MKNAVESKAEAEAMEAVQAFFRSKFSELEAIASAATSAEDLVKVRREVSMSINQSINQFISSLFS